jgi:two-component system NtrC family sensor kinase
MLPLKRELAALKFLDGLAAHLKDVREPHKALRHALRDTREFFQATHGCIATLHAGRPEADLLFTLPKQADWDLGVLTSYIRHTRPPVQRDMLMASLRRRGGAWGAIAFIRPGLPYDREDRRLLIRIATAVSGAIHRIDRDRLLGVRDRIDRKIMEQIHPKDLC